MEKIFLFFTSSPEMLALSYLFDQFLGSAYWPTALWQWAYFPESIYHLMGVQLMVVWIFSKVIISPTLFNLRNLLVNPSHAESPFFWPSCTGRYSEGESRYNISNTTIKQATAVSSTSHFVHVCITFVSRQSKKPWSQGHKDSTMKRFCEKISHGPDFWCS